MKKKNDNLIKKRAIIRFTISLGPRDNILSDVNIF